MDRKDTLDELLWIEALNREMLKILKTDNDQVSDGVFEKRCRELKRRMICTNECIKKMM